MGLRTKTALVIAATAALVATLIGLLVHQLTAEDQRKNAAHVVDAQLLEAVNEYASGIDNGALVNPRGLPAALRRTVTDRPVRATCLQHTAGSAPVLWAATRSGRDIVAVRRSYAPQVRALADLDRVLIGSGAAVTALGCVLGVVAAAGAGRRITASARTAQRIADGDLTDRVRPRGKDEIARLGAAVNTMADALSARLEAERRVTADIAHELRTPVAGLVTAVGLLPPGRPAELVSGGVDTLRSVVENVLEVARLDVPGVEQAQCEEVLPSALAHRAAALAGGDVEVLVHDETVVATDHRRVERILANLVTNARLHGGPPVTLEVAGSAVRVRDLGPGFPAELLTHGPQRFRTGARERGAGIGLGLTIVAGQARVLGARVTYENPPDGGALATVDLAPDS
ncbi:HAMP domain-containing protein [Streptomyces sp. SID8375]|uniref:histidine kinase n=2 Tax=Streptomyces nigrescens TaxID=1920 RepID=A0A640TKY1_STRNI|nr:MULTISPECIES: HAMP domain-containing sensor histidine kinase [Streptomyces]MYX11144.1 HAMP domain-containing protein [Streptomyces sp. SID8375]WAT97515.1 HAMP domain-containing histidine kinase [Streptomyces libani subsp. libani]WAU05457.1 HAMP domain-containing histidine kinase [Streptomyces nigrescens]GFE23021.1 sensor protein CseC [Streptomyces libani subsp. libani]GGV91969.1 sensor protein CseC [Streptomyces libani subsp. libani]